MSDFIGSKITFLSRLYIKSDSLQEVCRSSFCILVALFPVRDSTETAKTVSPSLLAEPQFKNAARRK